jgi:RNA recognition motif-containing protein
MFNEINNIKLGDIVTHYSTNLDQTWVRMGVVKTSDEMINMHLTINIENFQYSPIYEFTLYKINNEYECTSDFVDQYLKYFFTNIPMKKRLY